MTPEEYKRKNMFEGYQCEATDQVKIGNRQKCEGCKMPLGNVIMHCWDDCFFFLNKPLIDESEDDA